MNAEVSNVVTAYNEWLEKTDACGSVEWWLYSATYHYKIDTFLLSVLGTYYYNKLHSFARRSCGTDYSQCCLQIVRVQRHKHHLQQAEGHPLPGLTFSSLQDNTIACPAAGEIYYILERLNIGFVNLKHTHKHFLEGKKSTHAVNLQSWKSTKVFGTWRHIGTFLTTVS